MKQLCILLLGVFFLQTVQGDSFATKRAARDAIDGGKARSYLTDPDPDIRRYALFCVCRNNPAAEISVLKQGGKDRSPLVRFTVVALLSQIAGKSAEADQMLLELSNDPDIKVRNAASRYSWPFRSKNIRLSEDPSWDYEVTTIKTIPISDDNWKFCTDPLNRGHVQKYYLPSFHDGKWIKIRYGFWEKSAAPDYDGYAWYRIRFRMPPKMECNAVEVRFTGVDESAWVWMNGAYLGSHDIGIEGWNRSFSLDCRKEILFDKENLLVVRVLDREEGGGIWQPVFIDILK